MVVGVSSPVTIVEEDDDDIHVCELPHSISLSTNPTELPLDQLNEYPFELLSGEELIEKQTSDSKDGYIYLTNFRLFLFSNQSSSHCSFINCPIRLIESIEIKENMSLCIQCKDLRSFRLIFSTTDKCCYWFKKLNECISTSPCLENSFAMKFSSEKSQQDYSIKRDYFQHEITRLQLDVSPWRVTEINRDYKLSSSYPNICVVPASMTDEEVHEVAKFRSYRRFPTIVWR
jgi:myotubularin-related protein 3/4